MPKKSTEDVITNPILTDKQHRVATHHNDLMIEVVDLRYEVLVDKKWKKLLKGINISFKTGEMHALMGASGAGKSTLLDMLADRKTNGRWSGEILINNSIRNEKFQAATAYVLQDDVHLPNLTVEETLYFAVWTRVPACLDENSRLKRVEELLADFDLEHVRSSFVGNATIKGISGGQLKRLSIAVELSNPRKEAIFLDEPTSGLDSSLALEVMQVVRRLTDNTRLSITTIHQPSPDIFQLFDKVTVLSLGRLVYFGDIKNVENYFSSPNLGYASAFNSTTAEDYTNPAEVVIAITSGKVIPDNSTTIRQPIELAKYFANSEYNPLNKTDKEEIVTFNQWNVDHDTNNNPTDTMIMTSTMTQFHMLIHRYFTNFLRDKSVIASELMRVCIGGIFTGIAFYMQADISGPYFENGVANEKVNSLNGCFYFVIYYMVIGAMLSIVSVCQHHLLYHRELLSNAYTTFPYWLTLCIGPQPMYFVTTFVFIIIFYFMVGLSSGGNYFFYFVGMMYLCNIIANAIIITLSAASKDAKLATALFPLSFAFFATLSGYGIPVNKVAKMWRWATNISYYRWIFEGILINEWEDYDTDDEYASISGESDGNVLAYYDFDGFDKRNVIWICGLFIGSIYLLAYYNLLPSRSKLVKVDSTVTSASGNDADKKIINTSKKVVRKGKANENYVKLSDDSGSTNIKNENQTDSGWRMFSQSSTTSYSRTNTDAEADDHILVMPERRDNEFFRVSSGVVEQVTPQDVTFQNVYYSITVDNKGNNSNDSSEKIILRGVSGRVAAGELCALMGASGSGKTTLLDILARRKTTGSITGKVLYSNNQNLSSAYVMQDNILLANLTVKESLTFASQLRLPERWSDEQKQGRVTKLIDILGLQDIINSRVGSNNSEDRGISGGQSKRLAIGIELINLASLLFLDEPTTGLDDSSAFEVVSMLRNLSNQRRTVICTIHQPSKAAFTLFDTVLLLAEGRAVYYGPTSQIVQYFVLSPFGFNYTPGTNPAEFVIAVANKKNTTDNLADYFAGQERGKQVEEMVQRHVVSIESTVLTTGEDNTDSKEAITSMNNQIRVMLKRQWLCHMRNSKVNIAVLFRYVILGLFYGSVYYQLGTGTSSDVYSSRLTVFFSSIVLTSAGYNTVMPQMFEERALFYRERASKLYSTFAYWLSTWLVQIPLILINLMIYCLILYFLVGLKSTGTAFFYFYFFMFTATFAGMMIAYVMIAFCPTLQLAFIMYQPVVMLSDLFCGFRVYLPTLPAWLGNWLPYLSFMRYAFEGMTLNEFLDNTDDLPLQHQELQNLGFAKYVSLPGCAVLALVFSASYAVIFFIGLKYCNFELR